MDGEGPFRDALHQREERVAWLRTQLAAVEQPLATIQTRVSVLGREVDDHLRGGPEQRRRRKDITLGLVIGTVCGTVFPVGWFLLAMIAM